MPEHIGTGSTPSPQQHAVEAPEQEIERLPAPKARHALTQGLDELARLSEFPSPDALNRAMACFIEAAYACDSAADWCQTLDLAARLLRERDQARLDPELRLSVQACAQTLDELGETYGNGPTRDSMT